MQCFLFPGPKTKGVELKKKRERVEDSPLMDLPDLSQPSPSDSVSVSLDSAQVCTGHLGTWRIYVDLLDDSGKIIALEIVLVLRRSFLRSGFCAGLRHRGRNT